MRTQSGHEPSGLFSFGCAAASALAERFQLASRFCQVSSVDYGFTSSHVALRVARWGNSDGWCGLFHCGLRFGDCVRICPHRLWVFPQDAFLDVVSDSLTLRRAHGAKAHCVDLSQKEQSHLDERYSIFRPLFLHASCPSQWAQQDPPREGALRPLG